MNTLLETLPTPTHEPPYCRTLLNDSHMKAAIIHLEAGEEIELPLEPSAQEHLLVVIQGRATVRFDELNHVLNQEQAMHLERRDPVGVWNHGETPAKLLRVDVQRPAPTPLIVTMPPA